MKDKVKWAVDNTRHSQLHSCVVWFELRILSQYLLIRTHMWLLLVFCKSQHEYEYSCPYDEIFCSSVWRPHHYMALYYQYKKVKFYSICCTILLIYTCMEYKHSEQNLISIYFSDNLNSCNYKYKIFFSCYI